MNDIKILREFAKINSCCEELKTVNRLEKVCLIYWIIGNRKEFLCGGERGIRTLGTVARTRDFQSRTFGHSVISPVQKFSTKNRFSEQPILTNETYPCKLFAKLSSHLEIPSRSFACDTLSGFVC